MTCPDRIAIPFVPRAFSRLSHKGDQPPFPFLQRFQQNCSRVFIAATNGSNVGGVPSSAIPQFSLLKRPLAADAERFLPPPLRAINDRHRETLAPRQPPA